MKKAINNQKLKPLDEQATTSVIKLPVTPKADEESEQSFVSQSQVPMPQTSPKSEAIEDIPKIDDAEPKYDVLIGEAIPSRQYGVIGKASGKLLALDLNSTNTISLFGVQGGGKSYTVGTIVEMATQQLPGINHLPGPLATVIFHYHESQDYPPEFVSMVLPNDKESEIKTLAQEYGAKPVGSTGCTHPYICG